MSPVRLSKGTQLMKIISWNLNHRTIEKAIPLDAIRFFSDFAADLIVLNEFVDGPSRKMFKEGLKQIGYGHQFVSVKRGKQNQVFIASTISIKLGDIAPPQQDDASITNFLHVLVEGKELEVVGFRAPAYKSFLERQSYWRELATIMQAVGNRRIVFLGDVNFDPFQGAAASATEIHFNLAAKYSIPNPQGEWSFISIDEKARTRIDHAMVTEGLKVTDVRYIAKHNGITLAGGKVSNAITDHAVLALDLTTR
jgi:hypothetical protein